MLHTFRMIDVFLWGNVFASIISVVEFVLRSPAARTSGLLKKKLGLSFMDRLIYLCTEHSCTGYLCIGYLCTGCPCIEYLCNKLALSSLSLLVIAASASVTTGIIAWFILKECLQENKNFLVNLFLCSLKKSQTSIFFFSTNYISGRCWELMIFFSTTLKIST